MKQNNPANFTLRLLAFITDIGILCLIFALCVFYIASQLTLQKAVTASLLVIILIFLNPLYVYQSILLTYFFGGSFGKLLTGLRITTINNTSLSFKRIAFRQTIGYSFSFLLLGLGFFSIIKDPQKQGWHDKAIGSKVIVKENLWPAACSAVCLTFCITGYLLFTSYTRIMNGPLKAEVVTLFESFNQQSIDTSNWKTYTNNEGKYSFRYPPEYTIQVDTTAIHQEEQTEPLTSPYLKNRHGVSDIKSYSKETGMPFLSISSIIDTNVSTEAFNKKELETILPSQCTVKNIKNITVKNGEITVYQGRRCTYDNNASEDNPLLFVTNNGMHYDANIFGHVDESLLYAFISTFTFTNRNPSPSQAFVDTSWKTYQNNEYGFTISYPSHLYTLSTSDLPANNSYHYVCSNSLDFVNLACLYNLTQGGSSLQINVQKNDVKTPLECIQDTESGFIADSMIKGNKSINSDTFYSDSFASSLKDVGITDIQGQIQAFRHTIFHNNKCFQLSLNVIQPDTASLSENEKNKIFTQLNQMLSTFVFTK